MQRMRSLTWPILALTLLVAGGTALLQSAGDPPPALPAETPVGGVVLVHARPFTLDQAYTFDWQAERPEVAGGMLVVLEVDPDLVHPRQIAEPVLYVGAQTVERINTGATSGHVVAIVPAPVDARGQVLLDLTAAPIFFGEPMLPEQVDAARAAQELAAAVARGIAPPSEDEVSAALVEPARFGTRYDLQLFATDLIETWSPDETDLISGIRGPLPR
ncbi:MAG: hypothetical protein ACYTG2_11270 [Planctomycetota bacterium]|jgi:hypothetical protein